MAWTDALLGGGFALAGVALQQALVWHSEHRKYRRTRRDRVLEEQHLAFIDLVKSARRVQRALRDIEAEDALGEAREALAREVDQLTEAVAVVRLVVADDEVTEAAEDYEERAKTLERAGRWEDKRLRLTPLIEVLQRYEHRADDWGRPGSRRGQPGVEGTATRLEPRPSRHLRRSESTDGR